jgi:DNA-directed RNA polymerase subunit RPC12/RpoP
MMAHECPECGQVCYCGGDIDDCLFNFDEFVFGCQHCPIDGSDDYDDVSPPPRARKESVEMKIWACMCCSHIQSDDIEQNAISCEKCSGPVIDISHIESEESDPPAESEEGESDGI